MFELQLNTRASSDQRPTCVYWVGAKIILQDWPNTKEPEKKSFLIHSKTCFFRRQTFDVQNYKSFTRSGDADYQISIFTINVEYNFFSIHHIFC